MLCLAENFSDYIHIQIYDTRRNVCGTPNFTKLLVSQNSLKSTTAKRSQVGKILSVSPSVSFISFSHLTFIKPRVGYSLSLAPFLMWSILFSELPSALEGGRWPLRMASFRIPCPLALDSLQPVRSTTEDQRQVVSLLGSMLLAVTGSLSN